MTVLTTHRSRTIAALLAAFAGALFLAGCNRDSSTTATGAAPMPASPPASAASR